MKVQETMAALVPELVDMASSPAVSSADLLRRALVVARRLAVPELIDWINAELNGYRTGEVPDYRRVHGTLVAENPYHGPIPFIAPPDILDLVTDFSIRQSIPELLHLQNSKTGIFHHFPAEVERDLMNMMQEGAGITLRPALKFSTVQLEGVIQTVRSRVLDWALDLETRGVRGDGMSFSPQEKQVVQQLNYHFGNVTGSQIQIGSHDSTQAQTTSAGVDLTAVQGLIATLSAALDNGSVNGDVADELRADVATLKAQFSLPKPKWEIVKATARSIRAVLEGAAGNLMAELAKPHVQALVALASGTVIG